MQQGHEHLLNQHNSLISANRNLETQRRRYQALFELTSDGYLITDTNTVIQEANPVATRLLQTTHDSVIGKSLMEFVVVEDVPLFSQWVQGWPTWQALQEHEVRIQREPTLIFPVSLTVATMSNSEREIIGLRWLLRDITERKRAEEERAQLAAIVDSSSDAIISRTLQGTIESWNAGAEKLYGYSFDEIKGKPISILFLPSNMETEMAILKKIGQGENVAHYETVRVGKEGKPIYVAVTASPVRSESARIIGAS